MEHYFDYITFIDVGRSVLIVGRTIPWAEECGAVEDEEIAGQQQQHSFVSL